MIEYLADTERAGTPDAELAKIEQIEAMLAERMVSMGPMFAAATKIAQVYDQEIVIPLDGIEESERPAVANLLQIGIDQHGMRIASVIPQLMFPPLKIGDETAIAAARDRRDVTNGWWADNRVALKLRRRARQLVGYAQTPMLIRPGPDRAPMWCPRPALGAYPAPSIDPDEIVPDDCIFTYKQPPGWFARRYPAQADRLRMGGADVEIVEYVDADELTLYARGVPAFDDEPDGKTMFECLHRLPNRAERPLAVVPGRISLSKRASQFNGVLGMWQEMAKLMALWRVGTERSIFPEVWFGFDATRGGQVITTADAKRGIPGEVEGATTIQVIRPDPSPFAGAAMDRIEAAARQTGATPPEFGGYGATNIRTGRRGAQVLEAVVDFPIQEHQELLGCSLEEENKAAISVARAWGGTKKFSMYVPNRGQLDYQPRVLFPDGADVHSVKYALVGADANQLAIAMGQKIAVGTLAKETAMTYDPLVDDVDAEINKIRLQSVEEASLQAIATLAANPDGPWQPADFALFHRLLATEKATLYEAVEQVDIKVKERQLAEAQAAQAQAAQQEATLEQMPGLGTPGAPGVPSGPIQPLPPSVAEFSRSMTNLRRPEMQLPVEQKAMR